MQLALGVFKKYNSNISPSSRLNSYKQIKIKYR